MEVPNEIIMTIKKFLEYQFVELNYEYEQLTPFEKSLCTKEEYNKMVECLELGTG